MKGAAAKDLFTTPEAEAEAILLELADYIYANTGLKPMSKTLFAVSRLMLAAKEGGLEAGLDAESVCDTYALARSRMTDPPADDFRFSEVIRQCETALPRITRDVARVAWLAKEADAFGLVFNTLVRGRWDSGEGLGTFLTPETVVETVVEMALTRNTALGAGGELVLGDICGGTGRFPFAFSQALRGRDEDPTRYEDSLFSFDQASLATNYAKLNLHLMGLRGRCQVVGDSLVDEHVSSLKGKCAALATNPPFGAAKYEVTKALETTLPTTVLNRLTNGVGSTVDPAGLFLFRNLTLLAPGGVLGIVLPDGVVQSESLLEALHLFEEATSDTIEIRALVSLPTVTFALGGTVAKTSFLIISKELAATETPLFQAEARHVGFLKRGNRRISDPAGNDLPGIVEAYRTGPTRTPDGAWTANWRHWSRLGLLLRPEVQDATGSQTLGDLGTVTREYVAVPADSVEDLHVSVLDVDETGLIDILSSARNRPTSRALACRPGDILISCINPRIWRATVIPDLPGRWSCSPEFLLVRPTDDQSPWEIALRLHHQGFKSVVQRMAGGTSSSRQRVDKREVLRVAVPEASFVREIADGHKAHREAYYAARLEEAALYDGLHGNEIA